MTTFQVGQKVRVMVAECEKFTHEAEVLSISRFGEVEARITAGIAKVRKPEANKGEIYMFDPEEMELIEEAAAAPDEEPKIEERKEEEVILPALTGSERQVAWAGTIRAEVITWGEKMLAGMGAKPSNPPEFLVGVRKIFYVVVSDHQDARFWIDHKHPEMYQNAIQSEMQNAIVALRNEMRPKRG